MASLRQGLARCLPLLAALLPGVPAASQQAQPAPVSWVRVQGELDSGALSLLRRAVEEASAHSPSNLVVELDTPGGEIELMWRIARLLDAAGEDGVTTTAWVADRAFSAGALVAMACRTIYMRPQASIGSATVVQIGPGGLVELGEREREKIDSAMRSSFRAWAESHGRSGVLAEAMVDKDVEAKLVRIGGEPRIVTDFEYEDAQARGDDVVLVRRVSPRGELLNLTAREALELGMADGLADSAVDVLEKIGRAGAPIQTFERTRAEDLAVWLERISGLLLVAGVLLAFAELKAPGFGVPGFLSLVCFGVFLFGRYLVGLADVPHVLLIAAGFGLIAVEVFLLPGFLWTGIAGALCILAGLILTYMGQSIDLAYALDRRLFLQSSYRIALVLVLAGVGVALLARHLHRLPVFGRLVLAPADGAGSGEGARDARRSVAPARGQIGRALTALRPVGKVALESDPAAEHEARAEGELIERGARVRVLDARGGRLLVEPVHEPTGGENP